MMSHYSFNSLSNAYFYTFLKFRRRNLQIHSSCSDLYALHSIKVNTDTCRLYLVIITIVSACKF